MTTSANLSSTAPKVGRHRQSNSLVDFDPLLKAERHLVPPPPPPSPPSSLVDSSKQETREEGQHSPHNVTKELRSIAAQLGEELSPKKEKDSPAASKSSLKFPWQKKQTTTEAKTKPKKPRHRKTKSLASVPHRLWSSHTGKEEQLATTTPKAMETKKSDTGDSPKSADHATRSQPTLTLQPMIQDLMALNQEVPTTLQIPNLAPKPRPTSFLTADNSHTVRTSELDATAWQLSLPSRRDMVTVALVSQFLDTYETEECLLDLFSLVGWTRSELQTFAEGGKTTSHAVVSDIHRPLVENFLDCGRQLSAIEGFFTSSSHEGDLYRRRQVLIVEQDRQFLCFFRGTPNEQQGKIASYKTSSGSSPSDLTQMEEDVTVRSDVLEAVLEVESGVFTLLDKLTEENPFYDVVFCGHAFGAAMAAVASYRYATSRPELLVATRVTACPKVGAADWRSAVHSLPNLSVVRVERGSSKATTSSGSMSGVGHVLRIHPSVGTSKHPAKNPAVVAYKFGEGDKPSRMGLQQREKSVTDYVQALEALDDSQWPKDFYRQDGVGVTGEDNEARQMA